LADLAAEVLPASRAEELEAHVRACAQCSGLLAEAERVRGLLRAADPGPMPADVTARLDAVLAAEWARESAREPGRTSVRQGPEAFEPDTPPTLQAPARPSGGRPLSRPSRSTQRTRRQVREEERDDARPGRSRRRLALAAGVIVVAGGRIGGIGRRARRGPRIDHARPGHRHRLRPEHPGRPGEGPSGEEPDGPSRPGRHARGR
jgi:hypothetical protein